MSWMLITSGTREVNICRSRQLSFLASAKKCFSQNSSLETRFSILDPQSFRESRIEFRGSNFENQVSRIENQVSRIKFRVWRHSKSFLRISNRDLEEMIKYLKTKQ